MASSHLQCQTPRELPERTLPRPGLHFPPTPCPCLCRLELSLPGAAALGPALLPLSAPRAHPMGCVLSSAPHTPPGSRALPRSISACAGSQEKLTQVLTRLSVPSPKQRSKFPAPTAQPAHQEWKTSELRILPLKANAASVSFRRTL